MLIAVASGDVYTYLLAYLLGYSVATVLSGVVTYAIRSAAKTLFPKRD